MKILTNFIVVLILQYINITNHHPVHLNLHVLSVSNISKKLEEIKRDLVGWDQSLTAQMC